ncbi:MAG TPA: ATP synthase F0 subunit B, partial [Euzebyales bacterium]
MDAVTGMVLLAAEEGGEASGIDLVLPATAELIWGLVGFVILFAFVVWKVWPTLNQMLEERQQAIQGKLEQAEQIRTEAEELRRSYQERLREVRSRADELIEQARADAEQVREQKV